MLRRFVVYSLKEMGWSILFTLQLASREPSAGTVVTRVAEENRELYRIFCEQGEFCAELSGKFRHEAKSREDLPAVGDWTLTSVRESEARATIHSVLPRRSR